jgi:uncharacterized protein YbgA (DUF1722 family)/uncharacterized protein YbbK (DUF523 family)
MERGFARPRIVSSKCLEFEACRYNGAMIPDPFVRKLIPLADFSPVCAEMEIGLGVPRDPIRIVKVKEELELLQPSTGLDCTAKMLAFCRGFLDALDEVDGFILKYRSPSCGIKDVKIHSPKDKAPALGKGPGFFGGAVLDRFPLLPVEDEGRLNNFRIREHFLTRLFTLADFRRVKGSGAMVDLVDFHSENKFLLMAYNQAELKAMGNLVANREKRPPAPVIEEYGLHLGRALAKPPRYTSSINVLMHALGYFKKGLTMREKAFFLDQLELYRAGKVPLSAPVSVVSAWIARFDEAYLSRQTFFSPYPTELVEITDSGKGRKL